TKAPEATNAPAPTDTPTSATAGQSRDNPVPAGNTVDLGDMDLTIVSAVRPADATVKKGNSFNTKPESGQEYVEIDLKVDCKKASNSTCFFAASDIKAVGADGNVHEKEFISGVEGQLDSGDFFGGATRSGKMFYIVPKGDKSVVMFYKPFIGDPIY